MGQSEEYTKGFNNGYKIAKYKPELMEKMQGDIKGTNDYEKGMLGGIQEYAKEKEQQRADELLDVRRSKSHSKDKGRDLSR